MSGAGADGGRRETVLVVDGRFRSPDPGEAFARLGDGADRDGIAPRAIDLAPDARPSEVAAHFGTAEVIRIAFPVFSDGRGFTLARELRRLGYRGRLRAHGHLISDQLPMARACGFDEIEIRADIAERQSEADWVRAATVRPGYLDFLK